MLMKAITLRKFGGPDELCVVTIKRPDPGPNSVLLRVAAAGICHHDVLARAGKIRGGGKDQTPGHEIAGEIVAAGSAVSEDCIGRRVAVYQRIACDACRHCLGGRHDLCCDSHVLGEHGGGGFAEFTCVPAQNAIPIPNNVGFPAAALAACPIGTSVRAALGVARIGPASVVLITGAGGGLGLHQIQIAKSVSARVIAVTTSLAKKSAIEEAGADEIIISPDLRFSGEVWRLTGKQGVDAVLENVATGCLGESLRSCGRDAIVVLLGNIGAEKVEMNPGLVISRRIRIAGSGNATFADMHLALDLIARGIVRPMIGRMLTFPEAAFGHALIEQRAVAGRVVLSGW
jgi:D-arabinose 1-dehydrogenase-like Zn-dependent alcohol dehydrogenase